MVTERFIDYYAILDVPVSASKQEIQNKYNNIKNKDRKVKEAYETLTDEKKRKTYDKIYAQKRLVKTQTTTDQSDDATKVDETYIADSEEEQMLVEESKRNFHSINDFITENLTNKDLEISIREQLADQAEKLYRQNMWPLLEKVKKISGDNSATYIFICKLHAKTLFSLGEICMWASSFKKAIGMYNTALALACEDTEIINNCNKSLELARIAYEASRTKKSPETVKSNVDEMYISYTQMILWIFCGFIFTSIFFWLIILVWDIIF